jgi:hypothetical protein
MKRTGAALSIVHTDDIVWHRTVVGLNYTASAARAR